MVDYKVIGKRVQAQRKAAGLTQEELAERVNITVVYLSKIENGHVHPTIDLLSSICDVLHCDLGRLLLDISPAASDYQKETVMRLFSACTPTVKPIAIRLLEQLSQLR